MKANPYETERYLHEYLFFHYGKPHDLCPFEFMPGELLRFHERIREECLLPSANRMRTRALDMGCAVGRFTFELSRVADEVVGVDNSNGFILAAQTMARRRAVEVRIHESGSKFSKRRVALPRGVEPAKVRFQVGDAQNFSSPTPPKVRGAHGSISTFDIVAAINLICRLPSPSAFLRRVSSLVSSGGQLVIASPFSWLKEYTPRREWMARSDVEKALRPHFRLQQHRDIPFVIREHRRKYQLIVSEVLTFKRC